MKIVVGAGLAGLNAAATLVESGEDVRVLEARKRIGGRVYSRTLPNGAVIEMGAEFILPANTYIRERADQLGLELWDKGVRYGRREARGGAEVRDGDLHAALASIEGALAADLAAGRRSAAELVGELAVSPGAREYILARAEISAASSADAVPAADLLGVAHVDDLPSPGIAGGNQTLARALATRIGADRIVLGAPVERITIGEGGVRVAGGGVELGGSGAIVAVPASVLSEIELDPPLEDSRAGAFAAVRYGEAAKLFAPLESAVEPRAVMSMPERYWCWTGNGADGRLQPAVSAFAGSRGALERLGVAEGPERWLASLRALRPELEIDDGDALLSTWSDDRWVRAAYSISPGAELTERMLAPHERLAFCGEHTAGEFSGLMEGALRSGRDAALRLLAGAPPTP
jgi:monoamine oxidase